jgi:hypothetical protein
MIVIEASGEREGEGVALLEAHRVIASNATKTTAKPPSGNRIVCDGMKESVPMFSQQGDRCVAEGVDFDWVSANFS